MEKLMKEKKFFTPLMIELIKSSNLIQFYLLYLK